MGGKSTAQERGRARNTAVMKATLCVIMQGANVLHTGCSSNTASSLVHLILTWLPSLVPTHRHVIGYNEEEIRVATLSEFEEKRRLKKRMCIQTIFFKSIEVRKKEFYHSDIHTDFWTVCESMIQFNSCFLTCKCSVFDVLISRITTK